MYKFFITYAFTQEKFSWILTSRKVRVNYCMEKSHSKEANNHSASQETPRLLWNLKIHCCVHNSPPLVPILSQTHIHKFPPYFPDSHSNIILPSTSRSYEWSLPFKFSNKYIQISHPSHACYMARTSHLPQFDRSNNIWLRVQIMKLPTMGLYEPKLNSTLFVWPQYQI
jgi:hypothetical protein